MDSPKTLQAAILYFSDFDRCRQFLMDLRWPDGKSPARRAAPSTSSIWRRLACGSATASTQAEVLPEDRNHFRGFAARSGQVAGGAVADRELQERRESSCEIARDIGITQKSAWFMAHRIRFALHHGSFDKLSGEVEVDETFIGGKARNMHVAQRKRRITGTGGKDKTAVMGILERGGKVRTQVVGDRRRRRFRPKSTSTSKPARRSTPMRCCPTTGWKGVTRIK